MTVAPAARPARWAVAVGAGALLVGAGVRLFVALENSGIYWPDEVYQSLEPAHWLVFGYGLLPWEYVDGARNWLFPGLVAGVVKLAALAGAGPGAYIAAVRVLLAAASVLTLLCVHRLARGLGASPEAAWVAVAALSLWAPLVYFAPRALTETASALPVAAGLALALPRDADRRRRLAGAALLGLAAALRLQCALFGLGLVAVLLARRRWRGAAEVAVVLGAMTLLLGAFDRLTYGHWFQSVILYTRFNLAGGADLWGTQGAAYYLATLAREPGALAAGLGLLALLGARRSPALVAILVLFLAAHSLVPHKELRFAVPALPLLGAAAALGLDELRGEWRAAAAVGLLVLAGISALTLPRLQFEDVGAYLDQKPHASAWTDSEGVNRLLLAAHDRPDLCGLRILGPTLAWTGGYSYLDRHVAIYSPDRPPPDASYYNYEIAPAAEAAGDPVARAEGFVLARTGSTCRSDPGYPNRLPGEPPLPT